MPSIDQRIVEMRFDNDQFESGVSQSLSTLDKLKNALKFDDAETGLEGLSDSLKNFDSSGLESACDSIVDKFSFMGTVGDQITRRLTDSFINLGKSILNSITAPLNQIKTGGWSRAMNIDNAKFSLSGMGVEWSSIGKDLSYAVNETAYGLDSAAKAAASLAASGVAINDQTTLTSDNVSEMNEKWKGISSATLLEKNDLDQMSVALRAISGVASITNSSYDDIANVFTRVAGQGRVMATDLNSLAARGMNAAATLAEAFGVTEAELRDMVSKGKVSFEDFSTAMFDAYADHAVEANNTFTGSLANMKAALSKIGADFYQPFLEEVPTLFNAIRLSINNLKSALESGFVDDVNAVVKAVIDFGTNFFNIFHDVTDEATGEVIKGSTFLQSIVAALRESFYTLLLIVRPIGDAFADTFNLFNKEGWNTLGRAIYAIVEALVPGQGLIDGIYVTFRLLFTAVKAGGTVIVSILKGIKILIYPIENVLDALLGIVTKLLKAITGANSLKEVASIIKGLYSNLEFLFKILMAIIGLGIDVLADAIRKIDVTPLVKGAFGLVKALGGWISNFPIINDLVNGFKSILSEVSNPLEAFVILLVAAAIKIKEFVVSLKDLPIVKEAFDGIKDMLPSLLEFAKAFGSNFVSNFTKFVNGIRNFKLSDLRSVIVGLRKHAENLANSFKQFFISLKNGEGFVVSIKKAFSGLGDIIVSIIGKIKNLFSNIFPKEEAEEIEVVSNTVRMATGNMIEVETLERTKTFGEILSDLGSKVKGFLSNIKASQVIAIAFGGVILTMAYNLSVLTKTVTNILRPIGTISNFFMNLKVGAKNAENAFIQSAKIIEFAAAIWILVKALKALSEIPKENLIQAGIALGGIAAGFGSLMGIMTAIQMFGDTRKIAETSIAMSSTMLAIATSILLIVRAFSVLEGIDFDDIRYKFVAAVFTLISMVALLALFSMAIRTSSFKDATIRDVAMMAGTMLALSASMILVAESIKRLSSVDGEQIKAAAIALVPAIAALAIVAHLMRGVKFTSALGFLAAIVVIDKMLPKLAGLSKYLPNMDSIVVFIEKYKLALVALGIAAIIIGRYGSGFKSLGTAMAGVAIAVLALSKVVGILSSMDNGELGKGIIATGILVAMVAVLELLAARCKGKSFLKFSAGILVISAAIYLLAGLIAIMANLSLGDIVKGELAVGGLVAMIAVLEHVSAKTKKANIGVVVTTVLGIIALAGMLSVLANLTWSEIAHGMTALVSAMLVLVVAFSVIASMSKKIGNTLSTVAVIGLLCVVIIVLTKSLTKLCEFKWQDLLGAAGAMSTALIALVAAIGVLGKLGINTAITGSLAVAGSMLILIAAVELILLALGGLSKIPGLSDLLNDGIKFIFTQLNTVATEFNKLCEVFNQCPGINDTFEDAMWSLSSVATAFAAAGFMTTIGNFFSWIGSLVPGSSGGTMDSLVEMANGLNDFSDSLENLDETDVERIKIASEAIKVLNECSIANKTGGILEFFVGKTDLGDFGDNISDFGDGLVSFVESIQDFDENDAKLIKAVAEATTPLVELSSTLENSGGVLGYWAGENDIDDFGFMVADYGESMMSLADTISGFTETDAGNIALLAQATEPLVELSSTLENSGGAISYIVGNNDIDEFGWSLDAFAASMVLVAARVANFSDADVAACTKVKEATEPLVELSSTLENSGGAISYIVGDNTLGDFGDNLALYADGVVSFINTIRMVNLDDDDIKRIDGIAEISQKMADLSSHLPNININKIRGNNQSWIQAIANGNGIGKIQATTTSSSDLVTFGETLAAYADGVSAFLSKIKDVKFDDDDVDKIDLIVDVSQKMSKVASSIPNIDLNKIKGSNQSWIQAIASGNGLGKLKSTYSGSSDLTTFARSLSSYVDGLKNFFKKVSSIDTDEIDTDKIDAVINITARLSDLASGLSPIKGTFSKLVGDNTNLSSFGSTLGDYAKGLVTFNDAAKEIPNDINAEGGSLDVIIDITTRLNEMAETINSSGGLITKFLGNDQLSTVGLNLFAYAKGLNEFLTEVEGLNSNSVSRVDDVVEFTKKIQTLVTEIEAIPEASDNVAVKTIKGIVHDLADISTTTISSALDYTKIKSLATSLVSSYSLGLKSKSKDVEDAAKSVVQKAVDGFDYSKDAFEKSGKEAIAGYINGMKSKEREAKLASSSIGDSSVTSLRASLDEHSPSKETYKAGEDFTSGYKNGIKKHSKDVDKTADSLGDDSVESLRDSIGAHSDADKTTDTGHDYINGYNHGIQDGLEDTETITTNAGSDSVSWIVDGIDKASSYVYDKIEEVGSGVRDKAQNLYDNNWGSLLGLDEVLNTSTESTKNLTDATDDLEESTSDSTKTTKKATKATKKLTDEEKNLIKYKLRSTAVINTFNKSYKGAINLLGNTSGIKSATAAFNELTLAIYKQANGSTDALYESTMTTEKRLKALAESFNSYHDSIVESMSSTRDIYSEADFGFDDVVKPISYIKNYKDDIELMKSYTEGLNTLALKGFSKDVLMDLVKEGTSAYPKIVSMMRATADEVKAINFTMDPPAQEIIDNQYAIATETALMVSVQMESYQKLFDTRKKEKEQLGDVEKAYDELITVNAKLSNSGLDAAEINTLLADKTSDLGKAYDNLVKKAKEAGLSVNDVNEAIEGNKGFLEQDHNIEILNLALKNYTELSKKAAEQGKDISKESLKENTALGQSYKTLITAVERAGFTIQDLYNVMYNNSSFVEQTDYVEGLINVYTKCQETISKFKEIGDGIFDSVESNLQSAIGYFDKFDNDFEVTADDMLKNLQSNLTGIVQYKNNILKITQNGGGELLDLIGSELTPEYANALAKASESTLIQMADTIKAINAVPAAGASEAKSAWEQYGKIGGVSYNDALNQSMNAAAILSNMTLAGTNVSQGLANGMNYSAYLVTNAADGVGQALLNQIHTTLDEHSPSKKGEISGQNVDLGIAAGLGAFVGTVKTAANKVATVTLNTLSNKFGYSNTKPIGRSMDAGVQKGIEAGESGVITAAVNTAVNSYKAACDALLIASPSKKFYWIGKMMDAGQAKGIADNSDTVEDATTSAMRSALQSAYDLLNSDVDMNPTITPVIDLSDAQNGAILLSDMLNSQDIGFKANADIGHITTNADKMNALMGSFNTPGGVTYGDTILNVYGTQGQNVNQLADVVIKRLNNEYARRKAAWT